MLLKWCRQNSSCTPLPPIISVRFQTFFSFLSDRLCKLPLSLRFYIYHNKYSLPLFLDNQLMQSSIQQTFPPLFFSLVQSSSPEILSSGLLLHIYLTILASFLSSLIIYSSLTGQVSLPYSITLCTFTEYNLTFTLRANFSLLTKALNL